MAPRERSLRELSDRLEIQDLLVRYTRAIDTADYELLDTCFLPDAWVDYTSSGGIKGRYPEVRAWLEKVLANFAMKMHMVSNITVELRGDEADSFTMLFNPMGTKKPDGSLHLFYVGGHYRDKLVRTAEGWRIRERIESQSYLDGSLPPGLP